VGGILKQIQTLVPEALSLATPRRDSIGCFSGLLKIQTMMV
jgi:hypothetical protein